VTGPRTIAAAFLETVDRQPDDIALRTLESHAADGRGGEVWTWREYAERVARIAGGVRRHGIEPGDRVLLMLANRIEFHPADLGLVFAGATPISVYNSSSPDQLSYLAGHSRAVAVVTSSGEFAERVLSADLPGVSQVFVVPERDGDGGGDGELPADPRVRSWADVTSADPVGLVAAAAAIEPESLLTVIYTSGTVGPPKGVMLTHANVLAAADTTGYFFGRDDDRGRRLLSYLPMAHIAERNVGHYMHVVRGSQVTPLPDTAAFAEALRAVRPHVLFGPPRIWEKLAAGIQAAVAARGEDAATGFADALRTGREVQVLRAAGRELEGELAARWAAVDAAVFAPIRGLVGLDECEVAFSGAAPIPPEVIDFLRDIGLAMSEIYGMSECTGGMTWDSHAVRVGTVGRAFPGVEVRLAPDGEVLCRGPIVFPGYLDDPERTAEALDEDGWLHSGDIGTIDDDGYLRIVDRKKELIITAGGKNVSPANVEAVLKTVPLIGQAMAVGDARPYLVAVLTLDPDACRTRFGDRPLGELAGDPDVAAEVVAGVAAANGRLSRVESVRRIELLGEEWLPDTDLLTATMKLKRRGVLAAYGAMIEAMYAGGGHEVPV
jgi:long-chain acyl-CoA synthetase